MDLEQSCSIPIAGPIIFAKYTSTYCNGPIVSGTSDADLLIRWSVNLVSRQRYLFYNPRLLHSVVQSLTDVSKRHSHRT